MAEKSHLPRLDHMVQAIDHIRTATAEIDFEAFENDWRTRLAVERAFEIVSEASRHLPDDLKNRHANIPWKKIAGIGSVLRHDYEEVVPAVLWKIAHEDLAPLEQVCKDELAQEQSLEIARRQARQAARGGGLREPDRRD